MATTTHGRRVVKRTDERSAEEAEPLVRDQLEALARQGARQMLMAALSEEVDAYLKRDAYQRSDRFRGYRNGTTPRRLTLGGGTLELAVPRVRDVPADQAPFRSGILRKYQRRSEVIDRTFMKLFIEGLATRDFEPALRLLMGQEAPLSDSVIRRLLGQFKAEYEAFAGRDLSALKIVYAWADGIYLKAGLGTEKTCLMVILGADTQGNKHLLALREGYRESAESWGDLLRDCRQRGLNPPACWIADGALGLWAAVNEQCPAAAQQRCTRHKTVNVIDKLPVKERPTYGSRVREIWQSEDEALARKRAATLIADLRKAGYERAADCLADDLDRCLTFHQFPEEHWAHLRTTNPIESIFASVRLRTNAAKRFKKSKSAVFLVHQVIARLSRNWHRLEAAERCAKVPLPQAPKKGKGGRRAA